MQISRFLQSCSRLAFFKCDTTCASVTFHGTQLSSPLINSNPVVGYATQQIPQSNSEYLREKYSEKETEDILRVLNDLPEKELGAISKLGKRRASRIEDFKTKNRKKLSDEDNVNVKPIKSLDDLLKISDFGLLQVEAVCQAILKAYVRHRPRKKTKNNGEDEETPKNDKVNDASPNDIVAPPSRAFSIPQPSVAELNAIRSWTVIDLSSGGIHYATFQRGPDLVSSGDENEDCLVDHPKLIETDTGYLGNGDDVRLEQWNFLNFDLSLTDQKSSYHHGRFFTKISSAIRCLPSSDAYFLLDHPIGPAERSPRAIKFGVNAAFVEGVVVALLAYSTGNRVDFRCGVNVFKIKPSAVGRCFGLNLGNGVACSGKEVGSMLVDALDAARTVEDFLLVHRHQRMFRQISEEQRSAYGLIYLAGVFVRLEINRLCGT